MSLLLPFTSSGSRQPEKAETPLPALCSSCALQFTEERRKDSQSTEPLCSHTPSPTGAHGVANSMSAAFWTSLLYSYKT